MTILMVLAESSIALNMLLLACVVRSQAKYRRLLQCPIFGCLVRQGVSDRWQHFQRRYQDYSIVFFDIDDLHKANERYGYADVNHRIAAALAGVRSAEFIGRWQCGDELVCCVRSSEAQQAAQRIAFEFRANGLSVTVGVAPCFSTDLAENVDRASAMVQESKRNNKRGLVLSWSSFPTSTSPQSTN